MDYSFTEETPFQAPTSSNACKWNDCFMALPSVELLAKHISEVHVPQNSPFICGWQGCGRNDNPFNSKSSLVSHIRTHTGERPFKCLECPLDFTRADSLSKHVKHVHRGIPLKNKVEKSSSSAAASIQVLDALYGPVTKKANQICSNYSAQEKNAMMKMHLEYLMSEKQALELEFGHQAETISRLRQEKDILLDALLKKESTV